MFAYDYLKADPKTRGKLLQVGWEQCFNDACLPYSARQELFGLLNNDYKIDDTTLFWSKQAIIKCLMYKYKAANELLPYGNNKIGVGTQLPTLLYSIVQLNDYDATVIDVCRSILSAWRIELQKFESMAVIQTLVDDIVIRCKDNTIDIVGVYSLNEPKYIYLTLLFRALNKYKDDTFKTLLRRDNAYSDYGYTKLLFYCNKTFLTTLSELNRMEKARELLEEILKTSDETNIIMPTQDALFHSIHALQKAHDTQMTRRAESIITQEGSVKYCYTPEFEKLVDSYGFIVPSGPAALVFRGEQHHNCVGNYTDRHTRFDYSDGSYFSTVSRILFTKHATLELSFIESYGKIVATTVVQYKGAYNKNMKEPEALTNMRIALTGMPWAILDVTKQTVGAQDVKKLCASLVDVNKEGMSDYVDL
jgi:hypothetical protein